MASNDEAGPSKQSDKLDATTSEDDLKDVSVRSLNQLFPKVDNLEYFPLKVLLRIFTLVDDIDLLSLAENSVRFEKIAKMVVSERYTTNYFVGHEYYSSERYVDFVRLFGNEIKSIEAKDNYTDGDNHWIAAHLQLMNNLERLKLTLDFTTRNSNKFFTKEYVSYISITHLTLQIRSHVEGDGFVLSKFHNLKHLVLKESPCISFDALKEVVYNNPGLESLCISNSKWEHQHGADIVRVYPFDELMKMIVETAAWTPLKEFAYFPICFGRQQDNQMLTKIPDHMIDAFVDSLKHLESLALSTVWINLHKNAVELLHRFATRCKNIKNLKLHTFNGTDEMDAIQSFQRIEGLQLIAYEFDRDSIESLVVNLPFLRHLHLQQYQRQIDSVFVLNVLSKCPTLEKLTIASIWLNRDLEVFASTKFFNDFNDCIQLRNVTIEVKCNDQMIGTITRYQVVWRNKLVHWVGYDPSRNLSHTNLMDLVTKKSTPDANIGKYRNNNDAFDKILSFLDMNSLQALSNTNRKISQLVVSFVEQHAQQQGTFIITNEFFTPSNSDYKRLEKFAMHVTSLKVNVHHEEIAELRDMIEQFHNLNKLHVYTSGYGEPSDLIVPQIRHFTFDRKYFGTFSELYDLSRMCPDLEILELKRSNLMELTRQQSTVEKLAFRKLEQFTFKCKYDWQLQQIRKIFRDTNTRLKVVN